MPNYLRSDELIREATAKPVRGAATLAKEADDAKAETHAKQVKALVKKRDGHCRWPEVHTCRKGLECAHIVDASRGGPMETENLILVCGWIHRRGPESIHGKQLKVEKDTPSGADGAVSFWRQSGEFDRLHQPIYYLVKREIRPGEVERD